MPNVGDISVRLTANTAQFTQALTTAQRKMQAVSSSLISLGTRMTIGLSAPIALLARGVLKASIDFESAFAGVRKTVNATEDQFAALSHGIIEMSRVVPTAATDIAKVAEAAGQLGIETRSILEFTRTMIDLGETTNLSATEAAKAFARIANITGLAHDQFSNLGSAVVELGNNLATTEKEIADMALRISGAGTQVGLSTAEILGFSGALSSVGIRAQAGGTAISKVMIELSSVTQTGGRDLEKFARVAGVSGKAFAKAFKESAAGATIDFVEGLGRMRREGENVFEIMADLELQDIRTRDALLRLSGSSDLFRRSIQLSTTAMALNTALTEEAEKRYKTTASQLDIFRNQINEIQGIFGDDLNPAVIKFVEMGKFVVERLRRMDSATRNLVLAVAAIGVAIGPVLLAFGVMVKLITPVVLLSVAVGLVAGAVLLVAANWEKAGPIIIDVIENVARVLKENKQKTSNRP